MKVQQIFAKLTDKIELNERYMHLIFELVEPSTLDFMAGQYISIAIGENGVRRSYSLCGRPDVNHQLELLIDRQPQGAGVRFLDNLAIGAEIQALGPMGSFTIQPNPQEENLVFVATGSGIAPMRSMILDLLQVKNDQRKMILYWGMRYDQDLFWLEDWQNLAESFSNFQFHPVLSKPSPKWILCSGHVTDCLEIHDMLDRAGYYLCGNKQMIDDVKRILLSQEVPSENIHHELFY